MADNKVQLQLELIVNQFKQAIADAKAQTSGFQAAFKKMTDGSNAMWSSFVGNLGAMSVAGIFKKLSSAVIDFGMNAVKNAAKLQEMSTQLGVLLGSAKAGEQQLRSLQKFAGSSPFELPGIVEASKLLLGFGVSVKETNRLLPILGNIAAGSGKPIEELARIFGQVQAETKLTSIRLQQLNDSGISLGPTLAKQLGIPLSNLRKVVSEGKVSFEQFRTALVAIQSDGGTYFQAMDKQAATLNGRLSNLADTVFNLSGSIGKVFEPAVAAAVETMIKFLENIRVEEMVKWGKAIGIVAVGVGAVVIAMNAATIATVAWGLALKATPYGLIATLIGSMIYAVKTITENFNEAKVMVLGWAEAFLEAMISVTNAMGRFAPKSMVQGLEKALQEVRETTYRVSKEIEADAQVHEDIIVGIGQAGAEDQLAVIDYVGMAKLAKQRELETQLAIIQQEGHMARNRLLAENAAAENESQFEYDGAKLIRQQALQTQLLEQEQSYQTTALQQTFQAEEARLQAIADTTEREKKLIDARNKYAIDKEKLKQTQATAQVKLEMDNKRGMRQQELSDQSSFFSTASGLQNSQNKQLAAIGKAAAMSQLAMQTPQAVGSSYAFGTRTGGPILGAVFGGIALAAMTAQMAQLAGVKFATGGVVPGNSYSGDQVQARLNSGEMVLNRGQTGNLFNAIDSGSIGGGSAVLDRLDRLEQAIMSQPIQVIVGDNEIAMATYRGRMNGVPV